MASSRRTGTNENISTYGAAGFGRDYTSLATWESATDNNLVATMTSEVLECYKDAASFNDYIDMDGAVTSETYHRIVRPAGIKGQASWQGHDGTPNNGFKLHNQTDNGIRLRESYASIQDIVIQFTNPASSNKIGIELTGLSCLAVGLVCHDFTSADNSARGIRLEQNSKAINCIIINCDRWGFQGSSGNTLFYNCTAIDTTEEGFLHDGGSMICKNCLAKGNSPDFDGTFTSSNNNASSDATAPGTSSRINQTFTFVNTGVKDYHLAPGDSGAKNFGVSLIAGPFFDFDDDIDFQLPSVWSIGFDSLIGPVNLGKINTVLKTFVGKINTVSLANIAKVNSVA